MEPKDRIIFALDVPSIESAVQFVNPLSPYVGLFKVGLELITAEGGPQVVEFIKSNGGHVMYDAKFHDIPATMAGAVRMVRRLGVEYFTVHASAGRAALEAVAREQGASTAIAVTVLTSLDESECRSIYGDTPDEKVLQFVREARDAGIRAIVCSPKELTFLRQSSEFDALEFITPGVRPAWAAANDQKRITTPAKAIREGRAGRLVIGRPIREPPNGMTPVQAVQKIINEIAAAQ